MTRPVVWCSPLLVIALFVLVSNASAVKPDRDCVRNFTGKVLASDGKAILYESRAPGSKRVCGRLSRHHPSFDFGFRYEEDDFAAIGLRRFRVAGRWGAATMAAYDYRSGEGGGEFPEIFDLRRGRGVLSRPATYDSAGRVLTLVLDRSGYLAWVQQPRPGVLQLWLGHPHRTGRLVSDEASIQPRTVRFVGRSLRWQEGTSKRTLLLAP